ncbi:lariat debranching enzyme [Rhizoclosmatium sp. JEL0117]|nr:lariat debranching enzyme [Rhizoclosmatium sp. JEL0117]
MRVAIEGCCHGELDKIYQSIKQVEDKEGWKVDLLIICGDFQSIRNHGDLEQMAVPDKHKKLGNFHEYYSGKKTAPILTIFIGGNHEGSNYLWELYHGGWVAPNIYFMGFAGVLNVGGLRIGGMTGIFDARDYRKGFHEVLPYSRDHQRSIYHIRAYTEFRLSQITRPLDIFVSHDWPRGIYHYGDTRALLRQKSFFEHEIVTNTLGSEVSERLLHLLKPRFWFSAHLHVKFAALVPHGAKGAAAEGVAAAAGEAAKVEVKNPDVIEVGDDDDEEEAKEEVSAEAMEEDVVFVEDRNPGSEPATSSAVTTSTPAAPAVPTRYTKFLALDKCMPRRDFLQILNITPLAEEGKSNDEKDGAEPEVQSTEVDAAAETNSDEKPVPRVIDISYDEEWLAIVRATDKYMSFDVNPKINYPLYEAAQEEVKAELEWVKQNVSNKEGGLFVPNNFVMSAPPHLPAHRPQNWMQLALPLQNPQTVAFCENIGLQNRINSSFEITTYVAPPPEATPAPVTEPASAASSTKGLGSLPPRPGLNLPAPKHDGEGEQNGGEFGEVDLGVGAEADEHVFAAVDEMLEATAEEVEAQQQEEGEEPALKKRRDESPAKDTVHFHSILQHETFYSLPKFKRVLFQDIPPDGLTAYEKDMWEIIKYGGKLNALQEIQFLRSLNGEPQCYKSIYSSKQSEVYARTPSDLDVFKTSAEKVLGIDITKKQCPPSRTLLLVRSNGTITGHRMRTMVNQWHVLRLMESKGLTQIDVRDMNGTMTLKEQAQMISQYGLIISSHSSQLTNLLFAHNNAAVMEMVCGGRRKRLLAVLTLTAMFLIMPAWFQVMNVKEEAGSREQVPNQIPVKQVVPLDTIPEAPDTPTVTKPQDPANSGNLIQLPVKSDSIQARIPKEFRFIPSIEEKPLKRRAVMTLLTHGRSNEDDIDFYTMGTIFHAFTHLHRESTRIKSNDTEFVAMITTSIPPHYRKLFLQFGIRLLVVPPILIEGLPEKTPLVGQFAGKGSRLQFQHTKLQMWKLEGVYDEILYQDSDLFFLKESPVEPVFGFLNKAAARAPENATSYIGAVYDCGLDMFNGGMMVFKPSLFHYEKLYKLANVPPYQDFMEQSLISYYYKKFGTLEYLPDKYNIMPYGRLEKFPALDTIGFHQKFWNDFKSEEGFKWWGEAMLELRQMMQSMGPPASKYVVPGVPPTYEAWETVRDSKSMFDKTLLLSLGDNVIQEDIKTRNTFAKRLLQADHIDFQEKGNLLKALEFAVDQLDKKYDWMWFLLPGVNLSKNTKPLASQLGRLKSLRSPLIVFNDCKGTKTGSFLLRKSAAKYLSQYIEDVNGRIGNNSQSLELSDNTIWKGFAEVFNYPNVIPGFEDSWVAENNTLYYSYKKDNCEGFYGLEAFGISGQKSSLLNWLGFNK